MKISLIVLVYNEEAAIPVFYQKVQQHLSEYEVEIVFIDDGSQDNTELVALGLASRECAIKSAI